MQRAASAARSSAEASAFSSLAEKEDQEHDGLEEKGEKDVAPHFCGRFSMPAGKTAKKIPPEFGFQKYTKSFLQSFKLVLNSYQEMMNFSKNYQEMMNFFQEILNFTCFLSLA